MCIDQGDEEKPAKGNKKERTENRRETRKAF